MNLEPRKPTAVQAVYDSIAEGVTTREALIAKLGEWTALSGLQGLRDQGKIKCSKAPQYSLIPDAQRPQDKRGRKRV